jgi:hypothetical protein
MKPLCLLDVALLKRRRWKRRRYERKRISPVHVVQFITGDAKRALGGVDKFDPISGGGNKDHTEEALGELIVPGCDSAVDFQTDKVALDIIVFLIERLVMFDLDPAI